MKKEKETQQICIHGLPDLDSMKGRKIPIHFHGNRILTPKVFHWNRIMMHFETLWELGDTQYPSALKRNHCMLGYICMATAHRYNINWGSKTAQVVPSVLQLLSQGQRCHLHTAAPVLLHISKCLGSISCRINDCSRVCPTLLPVGEMNVQRQ